MVGHSRAAPQRSGAARSTQRRPPSPRNAPPSPQSHRALRARQDRPAHHIARACHHNSSISYPGLLWPRQRAVLLLHSFLPEVFLGSCCCDESVTATQQFIRKDGEVRLKQLRIGCRGIDAEELREGAVRNATVQTVAPHRRIGGRCAAGVRTLPRTAVGRRWPPHTGSSSHPIDVC